MHDGIDCLDGDASRKSSRVHHTIDVQVTKFRLWSANNIRACDVTAPSPQHAATINISEAVSSVEAESGVDVSRGLFL